jgi:hypothetical protein
MARLPAAERAKLDEAARARIRGRILARAVCSYCRVSGPLLWHWLTVDRQAQPTLKLVCDGCRQDVVENDRVSPVPPQGIA